MSNASRVGVAVSGGTANRFGFVDRALPDGVIERAYSNGRLERRVWNPQSPHIVTWDDNVGNRGHDRDLGQGRIERTDAQGIVTTGQQVGHGITVWENGQYVTVNETPLPESPPPPRPQPGGFSGLLVALGLGGLFGLGGAALLQQHNDAAAAEAMLYDEIAMQEEAARRARQQATSSSSGSSDGGGGGEISWENDDNGDGDGGDGVDSFG